MYCKKDFRNVVHNMKRWQTIWLTTLRRVRRWLTLPRTLRVTGTGWRFIGLTLIVGFAAMNTANNLLYLVFGCMLSFITASGILSELMLRKVALNRTFPKHLFAQTAFPVMVTLTNAKRFIASFSLLFEDFSQGAKPETTYVLKVPARQAVTVTYRLTFPQRGEHRPGRMRLSTRYPFGLFHKSATFVETDDTLLVYPQVQRLSPAERPHPAAHSGEFESPKQGRGLEIYGIRDYVPGDSSGRIHWKSTAKLARLMTKEFHDDQRKRVSVVLDLSIPDKPLPANFAQDAERAISRAASYIAYFVQNHFQLQLITPQQRTPFDAGQRHLFVLLRLLALFQPQPDTGHKRPLQQLRRGDRANTLQVRVGIEPSLPQVSQ